MRSPTYSLFVQGDFACFTRPEMKVERVSYDVPTPSAIRSIFESILWKPGVRWEVERVDVLRPIRWLTVRRNEVGSVISGQNVTQAIRNNTAVEYYADEDRQQRASLILRDVAYQMHAHFIMTEKAGPGDNLKKFCEMFERRAAKGQCINQPYLGCREFAADVRPLSPEDCHTPIQETKELGWMLYDMDFNSNPNLPPPKFFRARIDNGTVIIPPWNGSDVRG